MLQRYDGKTWEELGNIGKRPTDTPVKVDKCWAISPDGYGAYYYDTLEELVNDYLDLKGGNKWFPTTTTKAGR